MNPFNPTTALDESVHEISERTAQQRLWRRTIDKRVDLRFQATSVQWLVGSKLELLPQPALEAQLGIETREIRHLRRFAGYDARYLLRETATKMAGRKASLNKS
jgi:hypothetical protein